MEVSVTFRPSARKKQTISKIVKLIELDSRRSFFGTFSLLPSQSGDVCVFQVLARIRVTVDRCRNCHHLKQTEGFRLRYDLYDHRRLTLVVILARGLDDDGSSNTVINGLLYSRSRFQMITLLSE